MADSDSAVIWNEHMFFEMKNLVSRAPALSTNIWIRRRNLEKLEIWPLLFES